MDSLNMTFEDEIYDLIFEAQNGSTEARDFLVAKNQGLVRFIVFKRFYNSPYEFTDLIQTGNIGLIKAINTYDISKNKKFSTYASVCIANEILYFFRENSKHDKMESVDNKTCYDKDGNEMNLFDFIATDTNIEEDYIEKELYTNLRKIIVSLKEDERDLIILFYGLYGNKKHNQYELSKIFNLTQPSISRRIQSIIKKIRIELDKLELIEVRKKTKTSPETNGKIIELNEKS